MTGSARLGGIAVALVASAPFSTGADASAPARVALSASPARIAVSGASTRAVLLRNVGGRTVLVDATRARFGRRSVPAWLEVAPAAVRLAPGRSARLAIRIRPARRAEPGEHDALVLLTSRPVRGARVGVRMRLGLVVEVDVPGVVVRRLEPTGVRVLRRSGERLLAVALANRGNVTEELPPGVLTVAVVRRRRLLARLRLRLPDVRPGRAVVVAAPLRPPVGGHATAIVTIRRGGGLPGVVRRYPLRL